MHHAHSASSRFRPLRTIWCILLLTLATAIDAGAAIILDFGTAGTTFTRDPSTWGWSFKVANSLPVAALGMWDEKNVALAHSHQVGLWDSNGTLLAQAVVDNTSIPVASTSTDGRWLFTNLASPITIPPGTYILGAYYSDTADKFRESVQTNLVKTIDGVTALDRRDALPANSFSFPNNHVFTIISGYFGPNLSTEAVSLGPPKPAISDGGVVNGASFVNAQPVAIGSLISIFGINLAPSTSSAVSIPLPDSLDGVSVQFLNGGTAFDAPVSFVAGPGASSQVNTQIPWNLAAPGATQTVTAVVTVNNVASAPSQVSLAPFSPGIFTTGPPDFRAIAQNLDGTLAQPVGSISGLTTHGVKAGEALIIYATGLGAVDQAPADGGIPPTGTLVDTLTHPTVLVGGTSAQVLFSGLSPQFVGVNQVNIVVPTVTAGDKVPLQIQMGGVTSPVNVTIAVSQ